MTNKPEIAQVNERHAILNVHQIPTKRQNLVLTRKYKPIG